MPTGTGAYRVLILKSQKGHMLSRVLKRAGLSREGFLETEFDDPNINQLIQKNDIKCVLLMGEPALNFVMTEVGILRWRGRTVKHPMGIPMVISLDPQDLLAKRHSEEKKQLVNPARYFETVIRDVQRAVHLAKEGWLPPIPITYICDPTIERFRAWVWAFVRMNDQHPEDYLSFDIETAYILKKQNESDLNEGENLDDSTIIRISFAYPGGEAVSVPFKQEYEEEIRFLLKHHCNKAVWNGINFDVPLLKRAGYEVNGTIYDFMDGWHLLQSDLDRGLEFVSSFYTDYLPWKHLSQEPGKEAIYSAMDADVTMRCALGIQAHLKTKDLWDLFERVAVDLAPILTKAGRHGNYIDRQKQELLKQELSSRLDSLLIEIQDLVPNTLKRKKLYMRKPKRGEDSCWVAIKSTKMQKYCSKCNKLNINRRHNCEEGWQIKTRRIDCEKWYEAIPGIDVQKWLKTNGFNPNSSDQLREYMRHFKHPIGHAKDDYDKESADAKHLAKLVKEFGEDHPFYAKALDCHKVNKALSAYVKAFTPDEKGKVYSTYKNSPSTWRLASSDVPMQQMGKRESNPYAKAARKTIIASPDHVLVNADSSSIEAVFVGYNMHDEDYIALARKSVHGYLCCEKLGLPFTDTNIRYVKKEYKQLYDQMKFANHMTNYGGSPRMMMEAHPEVFPTEAEARACQQLIFAKLPKLEEWHWQMRLEAHKNGYLTNAWGFQHKFYDVFTYVIEGGQIIYLPNGRPKVKYGKDAKRCVAMKPQSEAGFFMRDNLLILGNGYDPEHRFQTKAGIDWYYNNVDDQLALFLKLEDLRQWMPANISVHDGYCLDVPKSSIDHVAYVLSRVLTRPIQEMNGLRVGCEVEFGDNWGELEHYDTYTI